MSSKYNAFSEVFVPTSDHGLVKVKVAVDDSVIDGCLKTDDNSGPANIMWEIYEAAKEQAKADKAQAKADRAASGTFGT